MPQRISRHDLELLLITYLPNCQIAGCKSFSVLKWEFWWKSVVVNCPEKEGDGPTLAKRELFPAAAACTIQGKSWEQSAIWTALPGTLTLVYDNQVGELWYRGKGQTNVSMAYNSLFSCHRKLGTRPRTLKEYERQLWLLYTGNMSTKPRWRPESLQKLFLFASTHNWHRASSLSQKHCRLYGATERRYKKRKFLRLVRTFYFRSPNQFWQGGSDRKRKTIRFNKHAIWFFRRKIPKKNPYWTHFTREKKSMREVHNNSNIKNFMRVQRGKTVRHLEWKWRCKTGHDLLTIRLP